MYLEGMASKKAYIGITYLYMCQGFCRDEHLLSRVLCLRTRVLAVRAFWRSYDHTELPKEDKYLNFLGIKKYCLESDYIQMGIDSRNKNSRYRKFSLSSFLLGLILFSRSHTFIKLVAYLDLI